MGKDDKDIGSGGRPEMHGTGGGAAFETTDAEWQCLDPRSNHLRDEGVVKKVKKLHTELRSDLEGPSQAVEQTGGSRSGGIVTDVDENEHDMKLPRGVSTEAGDHCEEVAKSRTKVAWGTRC